MQPGPTLYEAERLRKERGSRGLLGAVGEPMSYAPNPLVSIIGSGLLSAQYLTGEKSPEEGLQAIASMTPALVSGLLGKAYGPIKDVIVYHGTRATKNWMDDPKWMKKFESGEDIPSGIASSTFPIDKPKGFLGGLKIMDGLGPHVGTAEAANQRLAKNQNLSSKVFDMPVLSGSTAANNRIRSMNEAYVMPFDIEPQKPFVGKSGKPYTEAQLQSRLADIAESLGFSRSDTRVYSSAYAGGPKIKAVQRAVKEKLVADGYDAIPYINSHEDRGSVSWVLLNEGLLSSPWKAKP
jgi:hypothetical protein